MARYIGPKCKLSRREGTDLQLKSGVKPFDVKTKKHNKAPGQHGQARGGKQSEYSLQLREKQKVRRMYGLLETQFRNLFAKADRLRGITGENFLNMLERRLDNVVYRAGFAGSRAEARQLVRHGHFTVNGKRVNIPSLEVAKGDEVAVQVKSQNLTQIKASVEASKRKEIPQWIEMSPADLKAKIRDLPARDDITAPIEERLIVELYSK